MRDDAVIAAADRADVAMVFTGTRHRRGSRRSMRSGVKHHDSISVPAQAAAGPQGF